MRKVVLFTSVVILLFFCVVLRNYLQEQTSQAMFTVAHTKLSPVDNITFEGFSPSDLPVETAGSFLDINLTMARAIDLDIPDHLLRRADTIIYE